MKQKHERTINNRDLGRLYYRFSKNARYYGLDLGACGLTKSHKRLYVEMYLNEPPQERYCDGPSEYALQKACKL